MSDTDMAEREHAATARKWLMQALHDLEMAEKNVGIGGYDVASFLAHQAVEKLLKALIVISGRPAPRIHYLDELAAQSHATEKVRTLTDGMAEDYALSRYPDISEEVPYEQYNEAVAQERVRAAKEIFGLLKDRYSVLLAGKTNG